MLRAIFVFNFVFLSAAFARADWAAVYRDAKPSIPMIIQSGGLCSGALVQSDLIITAAHCVYRLRSVHVSWIDNPRDYQSATVVGMNKKADLALIQLSKKSERKPLALLAKGEKIIEGSAIATIGHPSVGEFFNNPPFDLDMTYLMSTGIVSGVTTDELISDMSMSPGNSGGPVLNEKGEVIGVVSRKRIDRFVGNIGFSANLNKAYELIDAFNSQKNPKFTWRNASSSSKFYLAYSLQSFIENYGQGNRNVWMGGYSIDIWDRVRLDFADNFSTTHRYRDYALGYKFAFEMRNHNLIYLTPTLNWIRYSIKMPDGTDFDPSINGYGLTLQATGLPFGIKYTGYSYEGKYYGVTALLLAF